MAKVSVIVPIYNSEKKLRRCLDTLIGQTLDDIEIILVNDASTDGSLDILLEYEKKDHDRILVINCDTNGGAGGARNVGLDSASGDYIGFVDSDDYIAEDFFESLYNKASSGDYDIVDSPLYVSSSDSIRPPIDDGFCDCDLTPEQRELVILSDGYIFTKLYRSILLNDNSIRFRPNVKLEDADFLLKAVLAANRFGNIHDAKYIYDNISDVETWSVRLANSSEYEHILSLLEEYGRILKRSDRAKQCQTAIRAAILHFYGAGVACCMNSTGEELSKDDLMRLIKLKNAKNNIFIKGFDNPYFEKVTNEHTIELLKYIDKLSL